MMEYKGYLGRVELDDDVDVFRGEVVNTRDVITFQGESVAELKTAFHESIDDYLALCAQRNEAPDKAFSGQFVVRIPPDLHRKINLAAVLSGKSLNSWVWEQLSSAIGGMEFSLPNATEYQDQMAGTQHRDEDASKDYTKYDVIAGKPYKRLNKRRTAFVIVKYLCDEGVPPGAIKGAVPLRDQKRLFHVLNGKPFDRRRYFCEPAELIESDNKTYALTNQWGGPGFVVTMNALLEKFSDKRITITESPD